MFQRGILKGRIVEKLQDQKTKQAIVPDQEVSPDYADIMRGGAVAMPLGSRAMYASTSSVGKDPGLRQISSPYHSDLEGMFSHR